METILLPTIVAKKQSPSKTPEYIKAYNLNRLSKKLAELNVDENAEVVVVLKPVKESKKNGEKKYNGKPKEEIIRERLVKLEKSKKILEKITPKTPERNAQERYKINREKIIERSKKRNKENEDYKEEQQKYYKKTKEVKMAKMMVKKHTIVYCACGEITNELYKYQHEKKKSHTDILIAIAEIDQMPPPPMPTTMPVIDKLSSEKSDNESYNHVVMPYRHNIGLRNACENGCVVCICLD